ncbi:MAG: hypothetical protein IKY52_12720 [Clostridia bacterium]|nr:hypothetical protein [Clostridia bacterium]
MLPGFVTDILVIRDDGDPGTYVPPETDTETDISFLPDWILTGSLTEMADQRTSFALSAETGSEPAETAVNLETEAVPAPERPKPEPVRVIGLMERVPAEYDYTMPVPENEPVDISYMEDAVLVGDSRMQGLILYCGLSRITSYTYKGLTVDSVFTRPLIEWTEDANTPEEEKVPAELWEDGKIPVLEALKRTEFTKVYIMLGINETGWSDPRDFQTVYGRMVDAIHEFNPQCLIYVLSVFPVTETASANHPYAKNDKIALYNQYLQEMAAEKNVFFVDLAPAVVNENGVLPEDSGFDGIHLNKEYCVQVLDHIFAHTVSLCSEEDIRDREEMDFSER